MVAVAKAEGCRFCTFSHREMILNTGESVRALAEFEGESGKDERIFTAIIWAQSMVENDFKGAPTAIEAELHQRFSDQQRKDLETVALSMKIMSSCGHQADGLISRLKGKPRNGAALGTELVMALHYFPPAVGVYAALALKRREPRSLLRDFGRFSDDFVKQP